MFGGPITDFGADQLNISWYQQENWTNESKSLGQGLIDTELGAAGKEYGNLRLEEVHHDPNTTSNDFMFHLGNNIRSGAGNVFHTAGLPAVAGAASGALWCE